MPNTPTSTVDAELELIISRIFNKGFDRQGFDLKKETAALKALMVRELEAVQSAGKSWENPDEGTVYELGKRIEAIKATTTQ